MPRPRLFLVTIMLLLIVGASSGCHTFNAAVAGLEQDVDLLVAQADQWSDEFLPAVGVSPMRYQPTHVDFPDDPRPSVGQRIRFGNPGR
jgi:hypothetical protein